MSCNKRCFDKREDAVRTANVMFAKKKAYLTPYACNRHERKVWHLTHKTQRYGRRRKW